VLGAAAIAIVLLGVAALPPWLLGPRGAALLVSWRYELAAIAVSTLVASGIAFLVERGNL
jgi:hypothetical protein